MGYKLEFGRGAKRILGELPNDIAKKIYDELQKLVEKPICRESFKYLFVEKLCKIYVDSYKVIYIIGQETITIIAIIKREKYYNKLLFPTHSNHFL